MANAKIHIGTQGFSYKDWQGNFYPQFISQKDFLRFYSSKFKTVEIDMTFYRIPTVEMVTKWAGTTPDDFVFTAKFPRTVTHEGSIESRLDEAGAFIKVMTSIGEKLGPLLLQFPYSFKPDKEDVLLQLMEAMPDDIRIAVELRNRKWLEVESVFDRMREKNIALCLIDHPWMPRLKTRTADFVYLRFLGDRKKIEDDFSYIRNDREEELDWWKEVIDELTADKRDIYAYFNNHYSGHAPSTAWRLMEKLGIEPSQSDLH